MKYRYPLITIAFLAFGCVMKTTAPGTPAAPSVPPQIVVANANLALAHAVKGVADSVIVCQQQAKCSASDTAAIAAVDTAIAKAGVQINAELNNTADAWPVQQMKILQIVTGVGLAELKAKVSPAAQLLIVSLVTLFDSISTAVGGPVI